MPEFATVSVVWFTRVPDGVGRAAFVLPRMTARSQLSAGRKARRIPQLFVGLLGYGASVMVLVRSGLGAGSWNVFSEGVARQLGISFGTATNLIALVVLLAWIPMRELPGLGTALNVGLVGVAADATGAVLPPASRPLIQIAYLAAGLTALPLFDALYLGARFGSGPRDGIMTGLVRITGRSVATVRTCIEVVVVTTGWLLGGAPGPGTVVLALSIGPLLGVLLPRVVVQLDCDHVIACAAQPSGTAAARRVLP